LLNVQQSFSYALNPTALESVSLAYARLGRLAHSRQAKRASSARGDGRAEKNMEARSVPQQACARSSAERHERGEGADWPPRKYYTSSMGLTLKARVRSGRLIMDEPIDLPEGTEVELVPADSGDALDEQDRARLNAALERSAAQFRAGQGIPADEALRRIGDQ
jgi:hypothetical protein